MYCVCSIYNRYLKVCVGLSGTLKPVPFRGRWFSMLVPPTAVKPTTPSSATWRPSLEFIVGPWSSWPMKFLRRATLLYVVFFSVICKIRKPLLSFLHCSATQFMRVLLVNSTIGPLLCFLNSVTSSFVFVVLTVGLFSEHHIVSVCSLSL